MGTSHTLLWWNGNSDEAIQTEIKKNKDSSRFSEPIFLEGVRKTLASVMFLSIAYIAIGE